MDKLLSSSVLRGRPRGGVGFLIKKNIIQYISFKLLQERFAIIVLGKTILVNIYMPTVNSDVEFNMIIDIIAQIELIIAQFPTHSVLCAGDLNTNLLSNSRSAIYINAFMNNHGLVACNNSVSKNKNALKFTYSHSTLNCSSYIDYFLVSSTLIKSINDFDVIDLALNASDHNPIWLDLEMEFVNTNSAINKVCNTSKDTVNNVNLRWDHADLASYYSATGACVSQLLIETSTLLNKIEKK